MSKSFVCYIVNKSHNHGLKISVFIIVVMDNWIKAFTSELLIEHNEFWILMEELYHGELLFNDSTQWDDSRYDGRNMRHVKWTKG